MNNETYQTNPKMVFIREEIQRFDENSDLPFRVAINEDEGGSYAYGSHAEERMYADTTVGYTNDRHEAVVLLAEAWDKKEELINQWYEDMKRK
jgi:hypothetical protein